MESDIIHFMTCNKIISTFHSFFNVAAGFFRRNARSEGAAEGGCGGNSVAPERPAGAKRRRSLGVLRKMGSDFFEKTPPFQICQRSCPPRGRPPPPSFPPPKPRGVFFSPHKKT